MLVGAGADVHATNVLGRTPLHGPAGNGHAEIVHMLVEAGADVNSVDNAPQWTPLHWSARDGYVKVSQMLIAAGADVHPTDDVVVRPSLASLL
mmetsp:Transcript_37246/g.80691  ORF Transcript_37246/g.80691 Transcript_37246/m.80691 type:complete len:93 (+) Transcript_37246:137-415(+)